MRFRDFTAKTLLADTDWLVGYDENGKYIRVPKSALGIGAGTSGGGGSATVAVQYSANGSSWHDSYTAGDVYMRIKAGSGAWSDAIRICVSAYDIWLQQGNSGSEADFLDSLKGEDGEGADLSGIQIQDIAGYARFLQDVNAAIQNAKNAIIQEAAEAAVTNVINQFTGLNLEDIKEIKSISEDDYITVVTADGLRKVKIGSLSDNVAVRTVSTRVIESSINTQLKILTVAGKQDGENKDYTVAEAYVGGTQMLFFNGQLLTHNTDYKVTAAGFTMITHTPVDTDKIIFMGVPK